MLDNLSNMDLNETYESVSYNDLMKSQPIRWLYCEDHVELVTCKSLVAWVFVHFCCLF